MFDWIVTCPENKKPAAVSAGVWNAAKLFALKGDSNAHLRSCSRWPEMAGCAEDCLSQIEASPRTCLVQTIVGAWYEGKRCHYCAKAIGEIVWHERPPALRMPNGTTREWKEIAYESLVDVFATAEPVCWTCHMAETFRREHAELVIERRRVASRPRAIAPSVAVY